jgi:hypothetical protein
MRVSRFVAVGSATTALTIGSAALAVNALGDHGNGGGGKSQLDVSLSPSQTSDPAFHSVAPGARNWLLDRGSARVRRNGRIDVRVRGLVLTGVGTPGSVTDVSASLFCGADNNTTPAGTTGQVPLSSRGNARIRARITVAAHCLAPLVLINPTVNPSTTPDRAHYIAVSGLGG